MNGLGCHAKKFGLSPERIKDEPLKYFSQESHQHIFGFQRSFWLQYEKFTSLRQQNKQEITRHKSNSEMEWVEKVVARVYWL